MYQSYDLHYNIIHVSPDDDNKETPNMPDGHRSICKGSFSLQATRAAREAKTGILLT